MPMCTRCGENPKAVGDSWCLVCKRTVERGRWHLRRVKQVLTQYGVTLEQYDLLLKAQDGKCAICKRTEEQYLCIDHDHATGKVRGLLCRMCNLGLGNLQDNPRVLREAALYLERHA